MPQPADRWLANFTAPAAAAGDFAADDGCGVGGAIATGSEFVAGVGFGGEADDGTRGSCTTTIATATTSTDTMAAPSNRTSFIGVSALQLRQHLGQLVEQLAGEIAQPTDPRREPLACLRMQVCAPDRSLLR